MKKIPGRGGKGFLMTWEKGTSGNPNGRPRKTVRAVIEQLKENGYEGVSKSDVSAAFESLLNLTVSELKEIAGETVSQETEYPIILRICAAKLLSGKSSQDMLKDMLDRAHGKAEQKQSVTLETVQVGGLSEEQSAALAGILKQVKTDTV